jgi:hypothetical protein
LVAKARARQVAGQDRVETYGRSVHDIDLFAGSARTAARPASTRARRIVGRRRQLVHVHAVR